MMFAIWSGWADNKISTICYSKRKTARKGLRVLGGRGILVGHRMVPKDFLRNSLCLLGICRMRGSLLTAQLLSVTERSCHNHMQHSS